MAQVLKTPKDFNYDVEIVGVGVAGRNGQGGVPLEKAAPFMTELMERDANGALKLDDDGNPVPLTGSKLTAAAKAFAEARGLEVVTVSEEKVGQLAAERGALPDFTAEDALSAAQAYHEQEYGNLPAPINTTPEEMNYGSTEEFIAANPDNADVTPKEGK